MTEAFRSDIEEIRRRAREKMMDGAVTDAYAYDPYGNLLGRMGSSDQPFTYIGRFGVRWEPVGGVYDMRARAYDPDTARFLTRDPVWPTTTEPATLNPYQYKAV